MEKRLAISASLPLMPGPLSITHAIFSSCENETLAPASRALSASSLIASSGSCVSRTPAFCPSVARLRNREISERSN